jgi:hypothetical protein
MYTIWTPRLSGLCYVFIPGLEYIVSNVRTVNYELESTWKGAGAAQFETGGSQRLQTRDSGKKFEPGTKKMFQ